MSATAQLLVTDFIANYHPRSEFCILFGSQIRGDNFPDSDIDLIVVYSDIVEPRHEKKFHAMRAFDLYIFDIESLHAILRRAKKTGKFALVNALIEGVPLPKVTPAADRLKSIARKIRGEGFVYSRTAPARLHIAELCKSLARNPAESERTLLSTDLYKSACNILLNLAGEGVCTGKQASRVLQATFPDHFKRLNSALPSSLAAHPTNLIEAAEDVVNLIGGKLEDGYYLPFENLERVPLAPAVGDAPLVA